MPLHTSNPLRRARVTDLLSTSALAAMAAMATALLLGPRVGGEAGPVAAVPSPSSPAAPPPSAAVLVAPSAAAGTSGPAPTSEPAAAAPTRRASPAPTPRGTPTTYALDALVPCGSASQTCDHIWLTTVTTVDTSFALAVTARPGPASCAPYRLFIVVDGRPAGISPLIGTGAAPATGTIAVAQLAPGRHQLSLQAQGSPGGCDQRALEGWAASVAITTER